VRPPGRQNGVVRRLAEACRRGDMPVLRALLDADAVAVVDRAGPARLLRSLDEIAALLCGRPDTELTVEAVNGGPGLVFRRAGRAVAVVAVTVDGATVAILWIVLDPAKLRGWHQT
jgi:hypothetical protein